MIGHGTIEIPPKGYGAVESVIADYQFHCQRLGHDFKVVNQLLEVHARAEIESFNPDVLHVHDDRKTEILNSSAAKIRILSSHDPVLFEKPSTHIARIAGGDYFIGCLSDAQLKQFMRFGVDPKRLLLMPNGARADLIRFSPIAAMPARCVCLAVISNRKRQFLTKKVDCIDYVGKVFKSHEKPIFVPAELSEWKKNQVHWNLTYYGAIVLVSKSEAAPLAVVEGLMAGLSVIVSEAAAVNLDPLPFVHVVSELQLRNPLTLHLRVIDALKLAPALRRTVREYAERKFDWKILVENYWRVVTDLAANLY